MNTKLPLPMHVCSLAILSLGVATSYFAAGALKDSGQMDREPNILCLKRSPFGKTIAMAMQGPVDVYWHEGEGHDHVHTPGENCADCGHDHGSEDHSADPAPAEGESLTVISFAEEAEEPEAESAHTSCASGTCAHEEHQSGPAIAEASDSFAARLKNNLLDTIKDWKATENTRHNPRANSEVHKFFIRREVEKKLFETYQMDPTNYASYGAYFLFLSESSLSDRAESITNALRLADNTVRRCAAERENVSALLTGASAAHDVVQLLITSGTERQQAEVDQYIAVAEEFLQDYEQEAMQMAFDGRWDMFSELRRAEMTERARLLRKLLEADRKTPRANAKLQEVREEANAG